MSIAVIYWAVPATQRPWPRPWRRGAKSAGAETILLPSAAFDASMVSQYDAIAFGCPAMGAEVLEESEFEPMFTACLPELSGKTIALFGSYGWGDGEWMRQWEDNCTNAGARLACDSVICCGYPDDDAVDGCKKLGAALAHE